MLALIGLGLAGCGEEAKPTRSIEMASRGINGGALAKHGEYAVVGSIFHGGSFWRTSDGERIYNWNHTKVVDDRVIISADIDDTTTRALTADASSLVLWDIDSGQASRFWTSPAEVLTSKLASGGRYAMLGLADHSAVIFDAIRGGITRNFYHKGRVRSVDISGDLRLAMTGSEDHTAAIWQLDDGERLFTIEHQEDVQLVKLSPRGRYALSAAQFDEAVLWDVDRQKKLSNIPLKREQLKRGLRISAAEFSQNEQELLLGYPNRMVELRRLPSLELISQWQLPKRDRWQPTAADIIDLAFDSRKNQYWVMASDGFVHYLEKAN